MNRPISRPFFSFAIGPESHSLRDPMGRLLPWATLMVIFDVLHWSLGGLSFGRILEDR
jgi:hypothetical protein